MAKISVLVSGRLSMQSALLIKCRNIIRAQNGLHVERVTFQVLKNIYRAEI